MFNMYDEANIDLEEMMYLQDVENEDDTEDTSNEKIGRASCRERV